MVMPIREFKNTGMKLGVDFDWYLQSYFVYTKRLDSKPSSKWEMHCGPYSTFNQAEWWINQIKEN